MDESEWYRRWMLVLLFSSMGFHPQNTPTETSCRMRSWVGRMGASEQIDKSYGDIESRESNVDIGSWVGNLSSVLSSLRKKELVGWTDSLNPKKDVKKLLRIEMYFYWMIIINYLKFERDTWSFYPLKELSRSFCVGLMLVDHPVLCDHMLWLIWRRGLTLSFYFGGRSRYEDVFSEITC